MASFRKRVNHRGGRIDFRSSIDLVEEASQQSFPASDAPAWNVPEPPSMEPQKDRTMSKKNVIVGKSNAPLRTPQPSAPSQVIDPVAPSEPSPTQVARLAYDLWESHGRPEGTDLSDWLQAENQLRCQV